MKVDRKIQSSHYANIISKKFNKERGFDPVGARRRATESLKLSGFSIAQIRGFLK